MNHTFIDMSTQRTRVRGVHSRDSVFGFQVKSQVCLGSCSLLTVLYP